MSLHPLAGSHTHLATQDAEAPISLDGGALPSAERALASGATPQPHRRPGRPTAQEQAGLLDTRVSILRQARRLFMQRGFADVSVGEIAEVVGVTKPTLYYHFQSKQGLYTAVLCDMMNEVGDDIDAAATLDAPVRERLRLLAVSYLAHARIRMEPMLRDTFELIGHERAAEVIAAYHERLITPVANLLRAGIADGEIAPLDVDTLTHVFLGLLGAFIEREAYNHSVRFAPRLPLDAAPDTTRPRAPTEDSDRSQATPSPETTQLADLLVSLFFDGVAAR